jgi:hypothetical protein
MVGQGLRLEVAQDGIAEMKTRIDKTEAGVDSLVQRRAAV